MLAGEKMSNTRNIVIDMLNILYIKYMILDPENVRSRALEHKDE